MLHGEIGLGGRVYLDELVESFAKLRPSFHKLIKKKNKTPSHYLGIPVIVTTLS